MPRSTTSYAPRPNTTQTTVWCQAGRSGRVRCARSTTRRTASRARCAPCPEATRCKRNACRCVGNFCTEGHLEPPAAVDTIFNLFLYGTAMTYTSVHRDEATHVGGRRSEGGGRRSEGGGRRSEGGGECCVHSCVRRVLATRLSG